MRLARKSGRLIAVANSAVPIALVNAPNVINKRAERASAASPIGTEAMSSAP
jgi:hypothetical protein